MNKLQIKNHRFLITGSTGFVGSVLTRELVNKGENVNILVRDKKLNWRLKDIENKLHIYESDLLSPNLSSTIQKIKPTIIFHLAAYGTRPNQPDLDLLIDNNIKGTINLLSAVTKNPFLLFVNTGSSSEYGIKEKPMRELDLPIPLDDYGVTKVASTLFCQKYAIRENLPIITFRLFSPYGPYEDRTRLIPYVILKALKGEDIQLSRKENVRDFAYVEDVVNAFIKVVNLEFVPRGDIFNISLGQQNTIEDVINIILRLTNSKSRVIWNAQPKRQIVKEPDKWEADIRKAKKILNWKPHSNLEAGLEKTVVWFKNNLKLYK